MFALQDSPRFRLLAMRADGSLNLGEPVPLLSRDITEDMFLRAPVIDPAEEKTGEAYGTGAEYLKKVSACCGRAPPLSWYTPACSLSQY
jgi:hypothetical protein